LYEHDLFVKPLHTFPDHALKAADIVSMSAPRLCHAPENIGTMIEMTSFPQKVALVTGAARGIGLATAKRFLAEGWRVALLDIEAELLRNAVAGLANADNTLALHCDVADAVQVAKAMDQVTSRFGRLDALVNNAGVAVFAPLLETSDADWNRILAVNLSGPFICT
jgi:NAD(P)-dependent dehydrogenase (short-subunit alcohol dehydrogenase family)